MEAQSGWSFQQGRWLGRLNVSLAEHLKNLKTLFNVLIKLGLLSPSGISLRREEKALGKVYQ
ncbi:MAG: hypothetical protein F6J97_23935 [Leptolyngbya sp. SIO4C1]|nr:hypothetical protein [Leptolyngbya sp. SIO4C1]